MSFEWQKGTFKVRKKLISEIAWTLKLEGDVVATNASGELRARLARRGIETTPGNFHLVLQAMQEPPYEMVTTLVHGTRTKKISLRPGAELPPNPFPKPKPAPAPEPVAAAEPAPAPLPAAANEELVAGARSDLTLIMGSTEVQPCPDDLSSIGDFEPLVLTDAEKATSDVDKLLMAMTLISEAIVQGNAPVDTVVAQRLGTTLEENERLRKKLREAQDMAQINAKRVEGLTKANRQLEANIARLRDNTPLDDRTWKDLRRTMETRPHARA